MDGRTPAPSFTEFGRSGRRNARAGIIGIEIGEIDIVLPPTRFAARVAGPGTVLVTDRSNGGRGRSNRSPVRRNDHTARDGRLLEFHHGSPAPVDD